jgi:hypothetical protein
MTYMPTSATNCGTILPSLNLSGFDPVRFGLGSRRGHRLPDREGPTTPDARGRCGWPTAAPYVSHRYDSMRLEQLAVDLAHGYETRKKFSVEEFLFDALKMLGLGRPSGSSRVSLGQQASSRGARREPGL